MQNELQALRSAAEAERAEAKAAAKAAKAEALSKGENGALDVAVHLARREKHDPQRVACAMHRAAGTCSSAAATSNVLAFARAVADAACLFTRSQLATLLHASARLSP